MPDIFKDYFGKDDEPSKPEMSEEDLEVLNDMRPDLFRQWLVEKLIDHGALRELNDIDMVIDWADRLEHYIKEGKKET